MAEHLKFKVSTSFLPAYPIFTNNRHKNPVVLTFSSVKCGLLVPIMFFQDAKKNMRKILIRFMPQLSDGFLWEIHLSNDALTELFMYSVIDLSQN